MSVKRRTQCLLLAGALALTLTVPALAAGYSDLPESHWAYSDLMEASDLGIIQGVGNGQMAPSATMSWGQFLTMLTRTFAPEAYQSASAAGMAWDQAGYAAAVESGLLREIPLKDFSVTHAFTFLWRRGSVFADDCRRIFQLLEP